MADYIYTATIGGNTLVELMRNTILMAEALSMNAPPQKLPSEIEQEAQEEPEAPVPATQSPAKRPRGRPPLNPAASVSPGNGAEKSTDEMRQEATDILKACWGKKNSPGAEKVVALQKKFGVSRFGEVTDDKVPSLLQAAVALQKELTGGGEADTGPF